MAVDLSHAGQLVDTRRSRHPRAPVLGARRRAERSLPPIERADAGGPVATGSSPAPGGVVTARIFEDSTGAVWEVFEVRRSSDKTVGVSPGLESGWLAFVGTDAKRRL